MLDYKKVAQWMMDKFDTDNYIYQETIVYQVQEKFGEEYVYNNQNGNLAINPKVLQEFRKISSNKIVWERGSRLWRKREDYDSSGRQQD